MVDVLESLPSDLYPGPDVDMEKMIAYKTLGAVSSALQDKMTHLSEMLEFIEQTYHLDPLVRRQVMGTDEQENVIPMK